MCLYIYIYIYIYSVCVSVCIYTYIYYGYIYIYVDISTINPRYWSYTRPCGQPTVDSTLVLQEIPPDETGPPMPPAPLVPPSPTACSVFPRCHAWRGIEKTWRNENGEIYEYCTIYHGDLWIFTDIYGIDGVHSNKHGDMMVIWFIMRNISLKTWWYCICYIYSTYIYSAITKKTTLI